MSWLLLAVSTLAVISASVWIGRGLLLLGIGSSQPADLYLRWREQCYVAMRQNPYDLSDALWRQERGLPPTGRIVRVDPNLGGTTAGSGYPPWAFAWANLFIPPLPWPLTRWWFFAANIAGLAVLFHWFWHLYPSGHLHSRIFVVSSALSANAIGTTLANGQWGVLLCALLVLATTRANDRRPLRSSFFYAVAILKPTFAFAHPASLLARRSWSALCLIAVLTVASAAAVGAWCGVNALEMLQQMLTQSARWKDSSYSIPDSLVSLGLPRTSVLLGCLAGGFAFAVWALLRAHRDALEELAICSAVARLFTYHQLYDNLLLIFLVAALARRTLSQRSISEAALFLLILGSLWIPGRLTDHLAVQAFQLSAWSVGLLWLVVRPPADRDQPGTAPLGSDDAPARQGA